jgi:hypothetical protein
MADTIQVVSWTLGQTCALRSVETCASPREALAAVGIAQQIAKYLDGPADGFGIWGDVCVTGYTLMGFRGFTDSFLNGNVFDAFAGRYPDSGFLISEKLGNIGGVEGLRNLCAACPANTSRRGRPAQCAGTLYLGPQRIEPQLLQIIERLNLGDALAEHFTEATPIWYGLWTKSPLSKGAMQVLRRIVWALLDDDAVAARASTSRSTDAADLRAFARAMNLADAYGLPLSVCMSPPGHTDFGIYTVFPHCPLCKAEADVERWKGKAPTALRACNVCGTVYSPAEMASSERMDDTDRPTLRGVLGRERFVAFAKAYLITQGLDAVAAERAVAEEEAKEEARQRDLAERRRKELIKDALLKARIFTGLNASYEDDDDGQSFPRFDAPEFAEVLRRCRALGVRVGFMMHVADGRAERHMKGWLDDPEKMLREWRRDGCCGPFAATYDVPEDLLGDSP